MKLNKLKKSLLLLLMASMTGGAFAQNWVDVTSTYISNSGFDVTADQVTDNLTVNPAANKNVTDWTYAGSTSWSASGCIGFGTSGQINGAAIPSTNSSDEASGAALAITGAWDDGSGYASYVQEITLPIGKYKLEYVINNVGQNSNFRTSYFGFATSSSKYYGSNTSYPANTWTTESVEFTITAETKGNVSVGFGWSHAGSGSTPKLVIDCVKLYVDNTVDKSSLESLITEAEGLYDNAANGAADFLAVINSAKGVDSNASATAADVINAENALKSAINTFKMANASETNPLDFTSYIKNPSFEGSCPGNGNAINAPADWTMSCSMSGWLDGSINTTAPSDGSKCYNLWAGTVTSTDMSQTVVLPAGKYVLSADFRIDNISNVTNQGVYAKVGEQTYKSTETIKTVASTWNSAEGWNTLTATFNVYDDNTSVKLGASSTGNGGSSGWYQIDNFKLAYVGMYDVTDLLNDLAALIPTSPFEAKHSTASETKLQAAINAANDLITAGTGTKDEITTATTNLSNAIADVNASIADYANLKTAIEAAQKYNVIDPDYDALVAAVSTANGVYNEGSAESCTSAIASLSDAVKAAKINDYAYVLIDFEYPVELGTWKKEGPTGELKDQHWSGEAKPYLEQSSAAWGQNSWTISYNQDLTLPAGDYVFKVAGRKAQGDGCTLALVVKNGENIIGSISNFPEGDTGLGINKSGATSFDPDDEAGFANNGQGRGFEWRYVKFTLSADATINVAVNANATTSHQWVSFCDATIQTNNEANIAMIEYNIALNDAKTALETNTNVTGVEKTALNDAINAAPGSTKASIEAATAALKEATTAFTAAAPAYDAYVDIKAKVANLDAAGQAKFAELEADIETELSATTIASVPASYIEAVKAQTTPGADMTGIIVNAAIASTDGWNNARTNAGQQYTDAPENTYFDVYNETRNMTQNIGKLQPGIYTLKCATRASTEMAGKAANVYVSQNSANLASTDIHKDGSADGELGNGWSWTEVKFAVTDNTTDITIGFYAECGGNQWAGADNFTLTFNGTLDTKVTISSTGLASFSSVAELAVPTGVEAYYTTECTATSVKMTKIEDGKIPANTGVILKAAAGDYTLTATTGATAIADNLLVAATYAIAELAATSGDKTNYILYQGEFRTWDESAVVSVAAGKAYLSVPVSAGSLSLQFGDATAIDTVNGNASFNGTRVNIAGQAVNDNFKGIVIMNGKKVLVK